MDPIPQRRREISLKKSLTTFSLSFILVVALGTFTRLYLNTFDLKGKIPQEYLNSDHFELQLEDP